MRSRAPQKAPWPQTFQLNSFSSPSAFKGSPTSNGAISMTLLSSVPDQRCSHREAPGNLQGEFQAHRTACHLNLAPPAVAQECWHSDWGGGRGGAHHKTLCLLQFPSLTLSSWPTPRGQKWAWLCKLEAGRPKHKSFGHRYKITM